MDPDAPTENTLPETPPPPRPRFVERVPWRRILAVALVVAVWVVIGLVCSPLHFRF